MTNKRLLGVGAVLAIAVVSGGSIALLTGGDGHRTSPAGESDEPSVPGRGEFSAVTIPLPPGARSSLTCVRLTLRSQPYEACMEARSAEAPAYWRVRGQDFVLYPDWDDPEAAPGARPPFTVETADDYLATYPAAFGFGCSDRDPRRQLKGVGDALEARYGPNAPPLSFLGCHRGPGSFITGNLETPETRERAAHQIWIEQRRRHWEIIAIVDYSLDRETRCAVLPDRTERPFGSARDACMILGDP